MPNVTPEQQVELDRIRDKWIDLQAKPSTDDEIRNCIKEVREHLKMNDIEVIIVDSPKAAKELTEQGAQTYLNVWLNSWAGWYEGAKYLGTEFDEEVYRIFLLWNTHLYNISRWYPKCQTPS